MSWNPFSGRVCECCALREDGFAERAGHLEAVRGQRLLLAFLNEASDVVSMIAEELDGCSDCLARLASQYLASTAVTLAHISGSQDNAAQAVALTLSEELPPGRTGGAGEYAPVAPKRPLSRRWGGVFVCPG
jgi:hypothetical protein